MNAPLRLSIVIPTFNERTNIHELLSRLEAALTGIAWDVIVVDDDSPDGTASLVRAIARSDPRVRCLQRIGRRGLSSACIDGMLASAGPVIAVMDADLQHDEGILPTMLSEIERGDADVVVGTRYAAGGSIGAWNRGRALLSRIATAASRGVLTQHLSDPVSGFFMLRRPVLDATVRHLSGLSFKILLDILTAAKQPLRVTEVPYKFRERYSGESKLDGLVMWEYGVLLAQKTVGRRIPVPVLTFSVVSGLGVLIHMVVLAVTLKGRLAGFTAAQSIATAAAVMAVFTLNSVFTHRDRRVKGWARARALTRFVLACGVGAVPSIGIATYLMESHAAWALAGLAGALVSAVWNHAVTAMFAGRWR